MPNELENDLNDLIGSVPEPVVPEPVSEPNPESEPSVPVAPPKEDGGELPPPELPPTPAEGKFEPAPTTPTAPEPPATPEPPPSVDPKDAIIAQLQETVKALQEQMETVAKHAMSAQAPTAAPDDEPQVYAFIEKEEDLDEGLKTVNNFNAMMSGILGKFQEMLLGNIQHMAVQTADNVVTKRLAVKEFYDANKDLSANKAFVGIVANELAAANPTWTMEQIMEKLGDEVRNRLRFNNVQVPPVGGAAPIPPVASTTPPPTPAFAGGSGARPSGAVPTVTSMQKEVNELISDFV